MKKILLVLTLTFCAFQILNAQDTITNQSVIELHKLGFEKEILAAKINNSINSFDTSTEALKVLKKEGLPVEVIAAMINNIGEIKKETGIFYKSDGEVKAILETPFTSSKTNYAAAALSYGIVSNKSYSYLQGHTSYNQIEYLNQVFTFKFDNSNGFDNNKDNWFFRKATSPNDFALIELFSNENKNHRGLKTGEHGSFDGSKIGLDSEDLIDFAIKDLGNGNFQVRANKPLKEGEYCFLFQGPFPVGISNVNHTVFAFTIEKE